MSRFIINTDGSCAHMQEDNWMGMGVYIRERAKDSIPLVWHYCVTGPKGTHNDAEYLAIMCAMEALIMNEAPGRGVARTDIESITIQSDSQLVIRQITGEYRVKNPNMKALHKEIMLLIFTMQDRLGVNPIFQWVSREDKDQKVADELSRIANPHYKIIQNERTVDILSDILNPRRYNTLHRKLEWGPIPGLSKAPDIS